MNTCLTCKWAEVPAQLMNEGQGICHREPPTTSLMMGPQGPQPITVQTMVKLTKDYCSHHEMQLVKPANGFSGPRLEK
jgi:hypothetical protein